MLARVCLRIAQSVLVWLGVSAIIFFIMHMVPGDPVASLVSDLSDPEQIQAVREHLGLDKPVVVQYLIFLGNALQGDLGTSYIYHLDVKALVFGKLGLSLFLLTWSIVLAILIAVPLGMLAAIKRETTVDQVIRGVILIGNTIPNYWLGTLLILVLVLGFRLFQISPPEHATPLELLWGLSLPAFVTSLALLPNITRVLRASLIDTIGMDWVLLARSKGLTERVILLRHVFRPSILQVVTLIGVQASFLIGGQIVVEAVFGLPGVGTLMINAVRSRDYPIVVGATLIFVILVMLINIATDILVALMDPRARIVPGGKR